MGMVILKKNIASLLTTVVVISFAAAIVGIGPPPPIMPSNFYGTAMINGAYVADGTTISAWIDGSKYAETATFTFEGETVYTIEIPADNPSTGGKEGGEAGDVVDFKIGGVAADQTGTWSSGTNVELNLTATTTPPAPVADFSSSSTMGEVPWIVNFTDLSTGSISSWSWDFGDGGSSILPNPSYEYATGGTYTVSLTVTGPGGSDTETKFDYITVTEPVPVTSFSGTPTLGEAPLVVYFTATDSGKIGTWSWNFGDGGTSSAQNPSHEYTVAGSYTVSLTVTGPDGSDTETKFDYITVTEPSPEANFTVNPESGVAPLTVDFTDLSAGNITAWDWDFGDGGSSSAANPSHEYSNPGTYPVSLTVSGPGGTDTKTEQDFITVYEAIVADFSASPRSGESPLVVNFSDSSSGEITSWLWTFGVGGSSSQSDPSHQFTGPGGYTVSLTVSGPAGSHTETKVDYIEVSSNPAIIADFSASPITGDAPLTVSFTELAWGNIDSWFWSFGDGSSSTAPNPTHTYLWPGVYTISLRISNIEEYHIEEKQDYITVNEPSQDYFMIFMPVINLY